jgi:chromosome segregation ATPase
MGEGPGMRAKDSWPEICADLEDDREQLQAEARQLRAALDEAEAECETLRAMLHGMQDGSLVRDQTAQIEQLKADKEALGAALERLSAAKLQKNPPCRECARRKAEIVAKTEAITQLKTEVSNLKAAVSLGEDREERLQGMLNQQRRDSAKFLQAYDTLSTSAGKLSIALREALEHMRDDEPARRAAEYGRSVLESDNA